MKGFMMHAGGKEVGREELQLVETPAPVDRWCPIPHTVLYDLVFQTVINNGLKIGEVKMGIGHEGNRFFALMGIDNGRHADYRLVIGLRNSHDKKFPVGLVVGSSVFVCDNLAFSGEIAIARKHTIHIMTDLPGLVVGAVGRIALAKQSQDLRIEAYRNFFIDDYDAHDIVIRAMDYKIIPNQVIPQVLKEWREPEHDAFKPRTAWSLFNAFTQVGKRFPVDELAKRTVKLHGMFDQYVGRTIDITPEA